MVRKENDSWKYLQSSMNIEARACDPGENAAALAVEFMALKKK